MRGRGIPAALNILLIGILLLPLPVLHVLAQQPQGVEFVAPAHPRELVLKVPELKKSLKDKDSNTRAYAAYALATMGADAASAVPDLLKLLKDKNDNVRDYASGALASIGAAAIPALVGALKDGDRNVRLGAVYALYSMGPAAVSAIPDLLKLLRDKDGLVRANAAGALGNTGASSVPQLQRLLKDRDCSVRKYATIALTYMGAGAAPAIPDLRGLLTDRDNNVRSYAAEALGRIGTAAVPAAPDLQKLLKDNDYNVRYAAAVALGSIGWSFHEQVTTMNYDQLGTTLQLLKPAHTALLDMALNGSSLRSRDFSSVNYGLRHAIELMEKQRQKLEAERQNDVDWQTRNWLSHNSLVLGIMTCLLVVSGLCLRHTAKTRADSI